jgi:hypothetical protein
MAPWRGGQMLLGALAILIVVADSGNQYRSKAWRASQLHVDGDRDEVVDKYRALDRALGFTSGGGSTLASRSRRAVVCA